MVLTVIFAWRYRKGKGGTYDPDFDHSTRLELAIWSAPLLIIIALGALTWSSTHLLDPFRPLDRKATALEGKAENSQALRVQVVSLDWKWLFIYPDLGIATVNDLVLPVDREVRFDITSSNMMNTFYAPTMAGMIYAMPGMQSTLHAVLDRPVDSTGYSGNYSGAGFSNMRFRIRGVSEQQFAAWVNAAKASGRAGRRHLPAAGQAQREGALHAVRGRRQGPLPPHPRALRGARQAVHERRHGQRHGSWRRRPQPLPPRLRNHARPRLRSPARRQAGRRHLQVQ
jgi:cytochrome o ubiquinol oxidase subunit II